MTNSTNAPLVGRRNPGIRGDFDLLRHSVRTSILRSTRTADRRNGDAMIAEQIDAADPIAQHMALVRYLDSLDFDAASWVADFETYTFDEDPGEDPGDELGDEVDVWIDAKLTGDQLEMVAGVAAGVAADVADTLDLADDPDMPGWGTTFNPEDVQWGFTVRTRF